MVFEVLFFLQQMNYWASCSFKIEPFGQNTRSMLQMPKPPDGCLVMLCLGNCFIVNLSSNFEKDVTSSPAMMYSVIVEAETTTRDK